MAAFWTFLSGVQNDPPSFLLHSEIDYLLCKQHILCVELLKRHTDVRVLFIHSSNGQSHLTILPGMILIRNCKNSDSSNVSLPFETS